MEDSNSKPQEALAAIGGSERVNLSPESLDEMMPPGEYVHTFMQGGINMLMGADWERSEILKAAENGCELSGEQATAMKHGAVVWTKDKQPVFVATVEAPNSQDQAQNCV